MKNQKKFLGIIKWGIIICAIATVIFFPLLIAYMVYNPNIVTGIPGKSDVWMGFWASYSGTVVTLLVAVFTLYNSKSISNLQEEYYQLNAGVNLRLVKVLIVPVIEPGNLNRYKIIFCFCNMAKSLIQEINICNSISKPKDFNSANTFGSPVLCMKVGERESSFNIAHQHFGLQDGNAILQFEINIKDSEVKKDFIKSYFYFSQFPVKRNDINLDADIQVNVCQQDNKKSKPDDWIRHLHIELFPEPAFDQTNLFFDISDSDVCMDPFEIKIKRYTWK